MYLSSTINMSLQKCAATMLAMHLTLIYASENRGKNIVDGDPIKVHFVPHSHMDAGWLKTYDGYYSSEVKKLLKSVFS